MVNETLPFGMDLDFDPVHHPEEASYNLTFTNKELDRALDLHYFGARYYQTSYPRFISPDPVSGKTEVPSSWNRYAYCRNDPMNYFDPNGLFWRKMGSEYQSFVGPPAPGHDELIEGNLNEIANELYLKYGVEVNFISVESYKNYLSAAHELRKWELLKHHSTRPFYVMDIELYQDTYVAPILIGVAEWTIGSVVVGAGVTTTIVGIGYFIPSFGTSSFIVIGGATTTAGGVFLMAQGVSTLANHANFVSGKIFGTDFATPVDILPIFPKFPNEDSHH